MICHRVTESHQRRAYKNVWRISNRSPAAAVEIAMSFLDKMHQARLEGEAHDEDPWCKKVEAAVRDKDAISSAALLDLLRVPATTDTARRLAAVMRSLNFIPIKSRRLMPGGHAGNTVTRGWARPIRETKSSPTMMQNTGAAAINT